MAIAKLMLLDINFNQDRYDDVLLKLLNTKNFHPEPASKLVDSVHGLTELNRDNPYEKILSNLTILSDQYRFVLQEIDAKDKDLNIFKEETFLDNLMDQLKEYDQVIASLKNVIDENKDAITQLEHVSGMNVNFDDLFSCKYLQIRFGKLPLSSVEKIKCYRKYPFFLKRFHDDDQYTWCMYITVPSVSIEIDNIFSSLFFERIYVPNFVHGTPKIAIQKIQEETSFIEQLIVGLNHDIDEIINQYSSRLNYIFNVSKNMSRTYEAQKYVVVIGDESSIVGFATAKDAKKIKKDFESIEGVVVHLKDENGDSRLTPPTKLENNWFCRPFRLFVEMYGVPNRMERDPTPFVALTYTLLFGIMFGDVGQGLIISLAGYIAYKKWGMELGEIGIRLGISSALFGIVFGSVFGNEEILVPFIYTMDPSSTMNLLIGAIGIGATLIIITMWKNMMKNFRNKHTATALFSHNGLSGIIFYVSIIVMIVATKLGLHVVNMLTIFIFLVLPCLLMFFQEPLERKMDGKKAFKEGFGGFMMIAVFEMFEVLLTFVANTMSYLRVGGFILSHAGMMLVVYTLAHMFNGIGYWITLILGNIFVMMLEGMIVGIQALRLEFYEMFSRYYQGNGIPFKSIK